MIKGISVLHPAANRETFDRLAGFFRALGFARGPGWDREDSRGASFQAPLGSIELAEGALPPLASIAVEVTSLDAAHQAATSWMAGNGNDTSGSVSEISTTDWKSRYFNVEPMPGHTVSFWAWNDPAKGKPLAIEGDLSAEGMKFAIVVARWNAVITERLLEGALDALLRSGARRADIQIVRVPGSWEIPAAARTLAERTSDATNRIDAVIALGCLLRGETAHYEAIYNEVSRGIGQSQQETGIPHSFGVLTCETLEQALNRAGIKAGNKGFEAALAAIEMVSLRRKLVAGASV